MKASLFPRLSFPRIWCGVAALTAALWTSLPAQSETTIRLGLSALPLSLGNPFRTTATPTIFTTSAMFDGLTWFDEDLTLQPGLAIAWENLDDLTWRFSLRPDVTFHDGSPFTAEAVVTAVSYLASDAAVRERVKFEIPFLASAEAIDALTVEIKTTRPAPILPRYLSALLLPEPETWTRLGRDGFASAPIGTGPFKLDEWQPTRGLLSAHQSGWRIPKADKLEIVALPDPSARVQGIQSGRLDVAIGLGPDDGETVEATGGTVVVYNRSSVTALSFILTRPDDPRTAPLRDVRVRRALNMAIDRDTINEVLLAGATRPAHQAGATGVLGFNPDLPEFPYDPDAARALLAEAGYPNGFSFRLQAAVGGEANDAAIFQVMRRQLSDVGVDMQIIVSPIQQYLTNLSRGDFDAEAFTMAWPAYPTLDVLRPLQMHSCYRRNGWYCNEEMMPLIEQAARSWDPEEQVRLRQEVMAWIQRDAPSLFAYESVAFAAMAPGVVGFSEVNGFIDFAAIDRP